MSITFGSSAALRHCDVRKNGPQAFIVGGTRVTAAALQDGWESEVESDCCLYSQECTGDEKTMAEWLGRKWRGTNRWIGDDDSKSSEETSSSGVPSLSVWLQGSSSVDMEISNLEGQQSTVEVQREDVNSTHAQDSSVENYSVPHTHKQTIDQDQDSSAAVQSGASGDGSQSYDLSVDDAEVDESHACMVVKKEKNENKGDIDSLMEIV